jgi:hypothetical protein
VDFQFGVGVQEFVEHPGDPMEFVADFFRQSPRMIPQRGTQSIKRLLAPQIQPASRSKAWKTKCPKGSGRESVGGVG